MAEEWGEIAFFVLVSLIMMLILLVIKYLQYQRERLLADERDGDTHQQDDIYNISSRVQGQDQWPTHDAYLSIDHITTANQLNKPNYNDAPPSYEEAIRIAASNSSGSSTVPAVPPTVVVVPKTTD